MVTTIGEVTNVAGKLVTDVVWERATGAIETDVLTTFIGVVTGDGVGTTLWFVEIIVWVAPISVIGFDVGVRRAGAA